MRLKLITGILLAGTVVGCAGKPPPPPAPMAEPAPAAAPAPMAQGPFDGTYRGTPQLSADSPASCRKVTRPVTVRVAKNNTFSMMNQRGSIGPDGTVTSRARRGMGMTGNATNSGLTLTTMDGRCTYTTDFSKS